MKKSYIIFITLFAASLVLVGCGEPAEPKVFGNGEDGEVRNYTQLNCEASGGVFAEDVCTCSEGFTYNEKSGFCADETGAPGGVLGEEINA